MVPRPFGGVKVEILRLQSENLALPQREDHTQMYRQMKGGVVHRLQGCQHGVLIPDGALLGVDLGRVAGERRLVDQVPLDRVGKGGFQQGMHLVNGGAGQQPLFLFGAQLLFFTLDVLAAGSPAQGRVELFDVIGAEVLDLALSNVRHDQVLHHRDRLRVGLGCPLVFAGLDRDPLVQHFLDRHAVGNEEGAVLEFLFHRDLALLGLLFGFEALPTLAGFAAMVFVSVADGIRVAALDDRCHGLPLLRARQTRNRNSAC